MRVTQIPYCDSEIEGAAMTTSHLQIRGKIFFHFDVEAHRFRLRWCQLEVGGVRKVWNLHTDFQTVMDTIAYAKNLVLNHLTDQGQADAVDHVRVVDQRRQFVLLPPLHECVIA